MSIVLEPGTTSTLIPEVFVLPTFSGRITRYVFPSRPVIVFSRSFEGLPGRFQVGLCLGLQVFQGILLGAGQGFRVVGSASIPRIPTLCMPTTAPSPASEDERIYVPSRVIVPMAWDPVFPADSSGSNMTVPFLSGSPL